jgi:acetyl esterase
MATEASEQRLEIDGGTLRVRVYGRGEAVRQAPLVLHLHGGAFVQGSIDTARTVPTLLAEAGAVVVSADYPLAPAQRFPHALEI